MPEGAFWEPILFWIFSIGMVGCGMLVILNRNPVASALSLVGSFVFMAALFVLLNALFLAAIQVLVYAGAVMVLFLFIIMLLDLRETTRRQRSAFSYLFGLAVAAALGVLFFSMLDLLPQGKMESAQLPPINPGGTPEGMDSYRLGVVLFSDFLLPFLSTGVLLLAATVGVVLLSKRGVGSETATMQGNLPPSSGGTPPSGKGASGTSSSKSKTMAEAP